MRAQGHRCRGPHAADQRRARRRAQPAVDARAAPVARGSHVGLKGHRPHFGLEGCLLGRLARRVDVARHRPRGSQGRQQRPRLSEAPQVAVSQPSLARRRRRKLTSATCRWPLRREMPAWKSPADAEPGAAKAGPSPPLNGWV
eukprot:4469189-Pyramimonas_sp.AAC.1